MAGRFDQPSGVLHGGEAVAYIGGGLKWSVSRRLIRLGGLSEGLRTAQIALRSQSTWQRRTYATASGRRNTAVPGQTSGASANAATDVGHRVALTEGIG